MAWNDGLIPRHFLRPAACLVCLATADIAGARQLAIANVSFRRIPIPDDVLRISVRRGRRALRSTGVDRSKYRDLFAAASHSPRDG